MSVGSKVFLGVVLGQLLTIALVFGWYFYALRSELDAITKQRAEDAVLQSVVATEEYFMPAETIVEAGELLLSNEIIGLDRPDQLERYFIDQLRLRPHIAGLYVGNSAGDFFYVMRTDEKVKGGTRTKIVRNWKQGREAELIWRGRDYVLVNRERDPADTYDPRGRAWYRSAVERRGRVWTDPYIFFTSHQPGITLASAIFGKDGAVEFVLGVDVEMGEISSFLSRTKLLGQKTIYICTSEGKVIAHSNTTAVLAGGAAGNNVERFRQISELPGIDGKLAETVRRQLLESAATRSTNVSEVDVDGQHHFVAVGRMSNVDWPWQLVVTVPRTQQLEPASGANIILVGVIGLATLLACAIAYAMSRAIGAPMAQLLTNGKLARNGNIELMEEINTGSPEVDETNKILKEFAGQRRRVPLGVEMSSVEKPR
jgi:hypothetical protein